MASTTGQWQHSNPLAVANTPGDAVADAGGGYESMDAARHALVADRAGALVVDTTRIRPAVSCSEPASRLNDGYNCSGRAQQPSRWLEDVEDNEGLLGAPVFVVPTGPLGIKDTFVLVVVRSGEEVKVEVASKEKEKETDADGDEEEGSEESDGGGEKTVTAAELNLALSKQFRVCLRRLADVPVDAAVRWRHTDEGFLSPVLPPTWGGQWHAAF